MRRALASSLAAVVLVLSGGAAHAEPPSRIAWAPCQDNPEGECGTLSVPLDWKKPRGQRVDLAVARHRATDPARRLGVLVVDPGGPGGSAAQFALSGLFSPEIRARFDIVGVDQRGTGGSLAIRCADLMPGGPSTRPQDEAAFDALLRHNQNVLTRCRERSGPIFDHADGATVARDLDAARRALGERRISYFGLSYGTVFGQAYAARRRLPEHSELTLQVTVGPHRLPPQRLHARRGRRLPGRAEGSRGQLPRRAPVMKSRYQR